MPRPSTDALRRYELAQRNAEIRRLAGEPGRTIAEIAAVFGLSVKHTAKIINEVEEDEEE
jgi:hypothetical protein